MSRRKYKNSRSWEIEEWETVLAALICLRNDNETSPVLRADRRFELREKQDAILERLIPEIEESIDIYKQLEPTEKKE